MCQGLSARCCSQGNRGTAQQHPTLSSAPAAGLGEKDPTPLVPSARPGRGGSDPERHKPQHGAGSRRAAPCQELGLDHCSWQRGPGQIFAFADRSASVGQPVSRSIPGTAPKRAEISPNPELLPKAPKGHHSAPRNGRSDGMGSRLGVVPFPPPSWGKRG